MAAQQPARASPELRMAPLSPRYRRNYTMPRSTTVTIGQGFAAAGWDGETIAGGRMDGHEKLQTAG